MLDVHSVDETDDNVISSETDDLSEKVSGDDSDNSAEDVDDESTNQDTQESLDNVDSIQADITADLDFTNDISLDDLFRNTVTV